MANRRPSVSIDDIAEVVFDGKLDRSDVEYLAEFGDVRVTKAGKVSMKGAKQILDVQWIDAKVKAKHGLKTGEEIDNFERLTNMAESGTLPSATGSQPKRTQDPTRREATKKQMATSQCWPRR